MISVECPEIKDGCKTHVAEEIKSCWTNSQAACFSA